MKQYSFHHSSLLTGIPGNTLALAVATVLPLSIGHTEEIKELPITQGTVETENPYNVNESTSPKYTQPLLDTAKTIAIIPQSLLQDRGIDSLRGALRMVPGISLAAGEGGTPTGDQMTIRGFNARNDILIDGVRDIAGYSRDIYNTESVEVTKGPNSAIIGRGSTGGSINLNTKTATLDHFSEIMLRAGTEKDYRVQLDSNQALGTTSALRINLLSDDGDVAGRDEVFNRKNAVAVSWATGLGTDSRFNINAEYQKQDNLPDYGLPWVPNGSTPTAELIDTMGKAPPVNFSNFYGNVFRDFEDITAQSITAKFENELNATTTLRVLGRIGSIKRQSIVTAPRFADISNSTDIRQSDEKTRDTDDRLAILQLDVLGHYQFANVRHDTVVGTEWAQEKFDRWNYTDRIDDNLDSTPALVDLYHPDAHIPFTGHYVRGDKINEATGKTKAIYVFDTMTLNPRWELTTGLRYDIFDTDFFYDLNNNPTAKLTGRDNTLSWNLGVVFKPMEQGSIYWGAGNSFNPAAEDLTASTRGNDANLKPEESINYEIGTKWEWLDGRLFTHAALFRTEKINALTDAPDGFFDDDNGNYNTLDGKQRVDGLELSATGQFTSKLSLTAGYTFQKSKVLKAGGEDKEEQEGNALARTPEHSLGAWGQYDFSPKLTAGLGAQYVGSQYNNTSSSKREKSEDYLILDGMLSYRLSTEWHFQLNGTNLTDKTYAEQLGGGHFIPGEGRYVSLSTFYTF